MAQKKCTIYFFIQSKSLTLQRNIRETCENHVLSRNCEHYPSSLTLSDNKVRYRGGWNSTISRFRLKSETMRTYLIVHSLISVFIHKTINAGQPF